MATSTKVSPPTTNPAERRVAKRPAVPDKAKPDTAAAEKPAIAKETRKRLRLVRDSFTMPENELALVTALKARAIRAQRQTKKSEVVRAAILALAKLDDASLLAALNALPPIKVGRPRSAS